VIVCVLDHYITFPFEIDQLYFRLKVSTSGVLYPALAGVRLVLQINGLTMKGGDTVARCQEAAHRITISYGGKAINAESAMDRHGGHTE
jgi:hypothetical protein